MRALHELGLGCIGAGCVGGGTVGNIGFDGYIDTCISGIYRIYRRYIGGYFFMNIDISKINKNTLKFIEILSKSVKMTLIIKYIHCNEFLKSK